MHRLEAREFVDLLKDEDAIVRLRHNQSDGSGQCGGRCWAVVIDDDHQIAVLVSDCGDPSDTGLPRGAIVSFTKHPEAEPTIVGIPAFAVPISLSNGRVLK